MSVEIVRRRARASVGHSWRVHERFFPARLSLSGTQLKSKRRHHLRNTARDGVQRGFTRTGRVPDLLREQAWRRPDDSAVIHGSMALTYRDLAARGSELASYLRYLGVVPDGRVGVFVEPSIELMTGVWGVLFAGGAYLPLSPEYPEERLRYMIDDSGASIIFCQETLAPRLAELAPRATRIITPRDVADSTESLLPMRAPDLDIGLRADNLAYVIYTSGSTGRPKGVMIEHRSVVNQLRWLRSAHGIDHRKVVLQKTPMSFDAAQWEILAPGIGGKVVMGSPGMYRDPEAVIEAVIEHRVTTLQCVPTLLRALLDAERLHLCTSLTQLFSGGEALSRSLAREFLETVPWCELVNLYGPTECTINSSAFTVRPSAVHDGPDAIPIGTPVRETQYHILGADGRRLGAGEVGELYIGGVQLARGYLHQPELTAQKFVADPSDDGPGRDRLFRTGDLAYWNADGTVQFAGRTDNQVKLRGFRVELDEIRHTAENHDWVRTAAVVLKDDPRTGYQNLVVYVELNPRQAALMDQGNHGAHHQSKQSRLQVRAQLSHPGLRDADELAGRAVVALPGREPTARQRRLVFARKTYRFFEGGAVTSDDLLKLLGRRVAGSGSRDPGALELVLFGEILRYFGQYYSDERLLPKYGYASPGSLYATQLYLELAAIGGLAPGCYYYHPQRHELVLIAPGGTDASGGNLPMPGPLKAHFIGKKHAIEPVYRNNIREVLEIEAGHMVGLFEEILPRYGLDMRATAYTPAVMSTLDCAADDYYLGTFEIVPWAAWRPEEPLDIYLQAHPGRVADLPAGLYRYQGSELHRISDELILKKHVIAINQHVYERASVGITAVSRGGPEWLRYITLGRTLQRLSMNDLNLGFMSSGYSSKTGNDLPSARRIDGILTGLEVPTGPSYFFVGGRISDEQRRSEGMNEDIVHMSGPAEMIKDDLVNLLPHYMIPNKVVVLDALPLTTNGKVDLNALAARTETDVGTTDRPFIAPRTYLERRIADIWLAAMKGESVSVCDDFFESGGNSLIAVGLINSLNKELGSSLPLQVLFDSPTVEKLARRLAGTGVRPPERVVLLRDGGSRHHVFCWPGLGGYPMNLWPLANGVDIDRTFHGVQA